MLVLPEGTTHHYTGSHYQPAFPLMSVEWQSPTQCQHGPNQIVGEDGTNPQSNWDDLRSMGKGIEILINWLVVQ